MTLPEIIALFKEVESGKDGQMIPYHLHKCINQTTVQRWETNQNYPSTFSGFLSALAGADPPEKEHEG